MNTFVDVDKCLAGVDQQDRASWPRAPGEPALHAAVGNGTPPDEKPGLIGQFCKAFTVQEAITKFELPYRAEANGRYTYLRGSVPEGGRVYDNGLKFHSEHGTDPATGQNNAFDLVRIHNFEGDMAQMLAFVASLPECNEVKAEEEFANYAFLDIDDDEVPPAVVAKKVERFHIYDHDEFMRRPRMEWIVRGVLPRAGLVIVYGESTAGKSFLTQDLLAAIKRGIIWEGNGEQCMQGNVLIIAAEGQEGARNRAEAYAIANPNVPASSLPSFMLEEPNFLLHDDAEEVAKRVIERGEFLVIAVDTASAVSPGANENSSDDMGRLIASCKHLHSRTKATVILIDHSGISTKDRLRGWSGKKGACDAQIQVERHGDTRSWELAKLKDGADDKTKHYFKLVTVPLPGSDDTSAIVEHGAKPPPPTVKVLGFTTENQRAIRDALQVLAPAGTAPESAVIEQAIVLLKVAPDRDLVQLRKDLKRTVTTLAATERVFRHEGGHIALLSIIEATPENDPFPKAEPVKESPLITDICQLATLATIIGD